MGADRKRPPIPPLEPAAFAVRKSKELNTTGQTAAHTPTDPTAVAFAPAEKKARLDPESRLTEEDELIIEARSLGQSWTDIAKAIPGRSATALRKYYNAKLRPKASPSALSWRCVYKYPLMRH